MSPTNNPVSVTRGALKKRLPITILFEAEPMIHPNVLDAYEQAVKVLKDHDIPFRATGGIALNLFNAGRPYQRRGLDCFTPTVASGQAGASVHCNGRSRNHFWPPRRTGKWFGSRRPARCSDRTLAGRDDS